MTYFSIDPRVHPPILLSGTWISALRITCKAAETSSMNWMSQRQDLSNSATIRESELKEKEQLRSIRRIEKYFGSPMCYMFPN